VAALIEVNISGDVSKHGFAPADVAGAIATMHDAPGVEVRGLMAMASRVGGLDQARRDFAALRQLRNALRQRFPVGISLAELSMGMSDDFEVAIEEGATIVRIGSALLEGVTV
jgi:uncharacterized pyridoxal phosphate-containing UPF0001 family protein